MRQPKPAKTPSEAERRRFRRVKLDLPGRLFFPAEGREAPCTILDMSPGGVAVLSETVPDLGAVLVLYLENFGRFEGRAVRHDPGGFGLAFVCTPSKRRRTAEQLIQFLNNSLGYEGLLQSDGRLGLKNIASFTRADGQIAHGEVSDISAKGLSLKTDVKPPLGEFVLIAQVAGRVSCHHADGIGIDFVGGDKAR
jgi:hypothetical protein